MKKLKSPETVRVKSINGKPLTSSMLLGMALEYVDAINSQEVPVVLNCFERVVQVESRRFTEKLFEELTGQLRLECDESLMPFEDEEVSSFLDNTLATADRRLAEQLGEVSSVEALIELREEFEKRLRGYFREAVRERNREVSRA